MEEKFGYHQDLKNGYGIVRARTTGQLRSWDIPRTMQALEVLKREWGNIEFPGLYILFDSKFKKVYVGEDYLKQWASYLGVEVLYWKVKE